MWSNVQLRPLACGNTCSNRLFFLRWMVFTPLTKQLTKMNRPTPGLSLLSYWSASALRSPTLGKCPPLCAYRLCSSSIPWQLHVKLRIQLHNMYKSSAPTQPLSSSQVTSFYTVCPLTQICHYGFTHLSFIWDALISPSLWKNSSA